MGIKAWKQIELKSVTRALLEQSVQDELAQVGLNQTAIAAISNSIGMPGGIASLNNNGNLPASQHGSISLMGFAGEVNSEAEMLALTVNNDGTSIEKGDRVDRLDIGRTLIFGGGDLTDPANWNPILAENASVTTVRNTSGSQSETGVVTLSDIAFSGNVADLAGIAAVATSGAAGDVAIVDSGDNFTATDVEGALAENAQRVADEATARGQAVSQAVQTAQTATNAAQVAATLVEGTFTGTQDDANNAFTVAGIDTSKPVFLYRDGVEQLSAQFATRDGSNITTTVSAPASDESIKVFGYPEAA